MNPKWSKFYDACLQLELYREESTAANDAFLFATDLEQDELIERYRKKFIECSTLGYVEDFEFGIPNAGHSIDPMYTTEIAPFIDVPELAHESNTTMEEIFNKRVYSESMLESEHNQRNIRRRT